MYHYRFAHIVLASPIPLASLTPSSTPASVTIAIDRRPPADLDVSWVAPLDDRTQLRRSAFIDETLILELELSGPVRITMNAGAGTIMVSDPTGIDSDSLQHLIADSALPHLLAIMGSPVLHGSAVERDGLALVALGNSGSGKSTLAAHLVAAGCRLITDDAVVLSSDRSPSIYPITRYLRLYEDSVEAALLHDAELRPVGAHTPKHHVGVSIDDWVDASEAIPVGVVLDLESGAVRAPHHVDPPDRLAIYDNALFGSVGGSPERRAQRFALLADLASHLPVFGIGIERTEAGTQAAVDQILALHSETAAAVLDAG